MSFRGKNKKNAGIEVTESSDSRQEYVNRGISTRMTGITTSTRVLHQRKGKTQSLRSSLDYQSLVSPVIPVSVIHSLNLDVDIRPVRPFLLFSFHIFVFNDESTSIDTTVDFVTSGILC